MSTPAPGWYPDGSGGLRWWNGAQWSDATAPVAPVAPAAAALIPGVPVGTPVYTRWIWWIVLLPVLVVVPTIGYLVDLQSRTIEFLTWTMAAVGPDGTMDPSFAAELLSREFGLILSPWYFALLAVGWGVAAIVIWFSYLDARDLRRFGYVKPFPWGWAFLSTPLVYVIGRSVVVRRRSGRGLAPLWVLIAVEGVLFVGVMIWSFWFTAAVMQQVVAVLPTTVG